MVVTGVVGKEDAELAAFLLVGTAAEYQVPVESLAVPIV